MSPSTGRRLSLFVAGVVLVAGVATGVATAVPQKARWDADIGAMHRVTVPDYDRPASRVVVLERGPHVAAVERLANAVEEYHIHISVDSADGGPPVRLTPFDPASIQHGLPLVARAFGFASDDGRYFPTSAGSGQILYAFSAPRAGRYRLRVVVRPYPGAGVELYPTDFAFGRNPYPGPGRRLVLGVAEGVTGILVAGVILFVRRRRWPRRAGDAPAFGVGR